MSHFSSPTDNRNSMDTGPEATPPGLNSYASEEIATQEWRYSGTEQQPFLSTDDQEGDSEVVAFHRPSSGSSPPAAAPVPGMSDKELRRSRAEALASGSQQQFRNLFSTPNVSQSTSSTADPVTESSEADPSLDSESREYSGGWSIYGGCSHNLEVERE